MNYQQNSRQQNAFLQLLQSHESLASKLLNLDVLLTQGFCSQVNEPIPTLRLLPLHLCVQNLFDEEIELIELVLQYADLSARDNKGRTVFSYIVPVPLGKLNIFFLLLDQLRNLDRQWMILRSVASGKSVVSQRIVERFLWVGQEREILSQETTGDRADVRTEGIAGSLRENKCRST